MAELGVIQRHPSDTGRHVGEVRGLSSTYVNVEASGDSIDFLYWDATDNSGTTYLKIYDDLTPTVTSDWPTYVMPMNPTSVNWLQYDVEEASMTTGSSIIATSTKNSAATQTAPAQTIDCDLGATA